MKKTLTVNLNGRVFNIDEDAYQLLDQYLRNLRIYFRKEEGSAEILADIEARIEELLNERVPLSYNVITIDQVEQVIAQVGRPDDFEEKAKEEDTPEEKTTESREETFEQVKKKFYRNPDDKKLAGLCSGLAAYFGWDVTVIRIIAVVLIFATQGVIVPVYFILWLAIPEAITAEQKLEMQGKPITVENIGKVVASGMDDITNKAKNSGCLSSLVDFIVAFFKVCLVGLGFLVGIPLIFALVIVVIVLFATLLGVGTGFLGGWIPWSPDTFLFVARPAMLTVCGCLILGIPLVALIYTLISFLFKLKPVHPGVKWTGIILWIAAIVVLPFSGFKADWKRISETRNWSWHYTVDHDRTRVHGNGIIADRVEILPSIEAIEVDKYLVGNLQIEQVAGDSASLLINGDSNLIDKIKVKMIDGNTLLLSTDDYYRFRPSSVLTIRIQTPNPKKIKVLSVGNVNIPNALRMPEFFIQMEGAGKIHADSLYVDVLKIRNEGVGSVRVAGVAQNTTFEIEGVGSIHALELVSDSVHATVNGVGTIHCNPVGYLHGYVNGVGNIKYKSEPKSKNANINGVGKIKKN